MSMEDLWLRQSVHGWVLFLSIKSVYTTKVKEITEASASVGLLLDTAVITIKSGPLQKTNKWQDNKNRNH